MAKTFTSFQKLKLITAFKMCNDEQIYIIAELVEKELARRKKKSVKS